MYSVHIPRCNHIKTNGTQCGSPALRGRRFCFFHKNWRGERIQLNAPRQTGAVINLPVLEDADSIQVALMQVLRLILGGEIESRMAGLLLYGLQTASLNLRQMKLELLQKDEVVVVPEWTSQTGVGDKAWCEEDFEEDEDDEEDDEDSEEEEDDEDSEEEVDDEEVDEPVGEAQAACPPKGSSPVAVDKRPSVAKKPPASAHTSAPPKKEASVARQACPEPAPEPSRASVASPPIEHRSHPDERNPPPDLRPGLPEELQGLSFKEQLRRVQETAEPGSWSADFSRYILEKAFADPPPEAPAASEALEEITAS
jgi:hypothetical protein